MNEIINFLSTTGISLALKIIGGLLIIIVGFRIVKLIMKLICKGRGYARLEPSVRSFLNSFLSIALKTIVVFTAVSAFGVPLTAFVTLLGSAGLAIGLALQGSLSNFAGGIMILIFRPFKIGDYIDNHTDSGSVQEIGIFYTSLLTADNRIVTIPNSTLSNSSVVNYSAMPTRRVDFEFSVSYTADAETVIKVMTAVAKVNEYILDTPAPMAMMVRHDDSAVVYMLRTWCKTEHYWDLTYSIYGEMKRGFDKTGIEIPFPQIDVHIDK